jgi:hypothetical protein
MRRVALTSLLALLLVPAAAAAQPDTTVLEGIRRDAPLAAHGDRLAWSQLRDDGRWQLVTLRAGDAAPEPVPVGPRGFAFDVDLGPDERGHLAAVYSRCRVETVAPRGCDLYEYDFAEGRETRVEGASSPIASETDPTVWGARIAFQRRFDRKPAYPYLYVRPLVGGGPSTRVAAGQRNECRRIDGRTRCTTATRSRAEGLELYGRRLAFTWKYAAFGEGLAADLRLVTLDGGPRRVVDRSGRGGLTQVEARWPGFDAGRLYWVRTCAGDPGGCVRRAGQRRTRLAGGPVEHVSWPRDVRSFDRGAGGGFAITGACEYDPPDGAPCRLRRLDPVWVD